MHMWCPPTPPQQDTDVYMDHTLSFLYNPKVMTESQLPPIFIKREAKRLRHDAGLIESRRPAKILRKEDSSVYAPRSLFERPSPALVKMRRDIKLQKYRGVVKPSALGIPGVKTTCSKAPEAPIWHNWTIHEDMALLRVIQTFQGLPLNLMVISPGHIPNWEFVADYVNTVSIAHRTSKQCRHRYDTVILPREEGKLMFDSSARKKKNKAGLYKFSSITKSHRPLRTSQLFSQDNNGKFTQMMIQHHEALKGVSTKQTPPAKSLLNNSSLKIPKHTAVLSECGIDLDRPVLPVEVAARRAERFAREKKSLTPEKLAVAQRLQLMKATQMAGGQSSPILQSSVAQLVATTTTALPITTSPISQPHVINQTNPVVTPMTTGTIVTSTTCIPNQLRTQRIIATPIQTPTTVVSVSGLNPTLQHGTQRLIVSGTAAQAKAVLGNATTVTGKPISPAQLQMIRQATLKQQQLRLQSGGLTTQGVKTTVTVAGQTAIQVQFTQSQPRTQFIKQGTVTVSNKQGITRTVTESEMAQLLKRQQQLQHQKALAAAAGVSNIGASQSGIQSLSPQVFAQALQAGSPGPVATLVKAVSGSGVTQTVSIPVTAVTIGGSTVKAAIASGIKPNTAQHLRQLQLQQQLLAQKKLVNQKIAGLAQVGKSGVATQLIVGSKPLPTAMTMQQFQQVIRSPITVQQGPVVLTKGTQRVIPVNTSQGKQTIQVVASQGLSTAIRPQASSTLAGALAGIKVQGATTSQAQQALLSQVSAALQSQTVGLRQSSPVRIQTANGNPIVAVSVQSGSNMQQGTLSSSNAERLEQMARFLKK